MADLRLAIAGCDTSHAVEFSKRLLHRDIDPAQWVEGGTVVAAWPGSSAISPERVPGHVEALRGYGVRIVDRVEDLRDAGVDAVLVESSEGGVHRALAVPFLEAGVPVFIDKPFACSTADAAAMAEVAARTKAPLLSASSLRFAREVIAGRESAGRVLGAAAYSPASLHPLNPGLFHYGVHGVETLYALMGPGCRTVRCTATAGADDALGVWKDDRMGGVRGTRAGAHAYGFTVFGEQRVVGSPVEARWMYHELLKVIVRTLSGAAPSPVSLAELIEVVAFQECALKSAHAGGAPVNLPVV